MAQYLVLQDFVAGRNNFTAGTIIESTTLDFESLVASGLCCTLYDAAVHGRAVDSFLTQRRVLAVDAPSLPTVIAGQRVLTDVYVDSSNGFDSRSGASAATAVRTLAAALSRVPTDREATVHLAASDTPYDRAGLLTAMQGRTATLRIVCDDLTEVIPAFALGASTELALVAAVSQSWTANALATYFVEVMSSTNETLEGTVRAIARNTATTIYPVTGMQDSTVPTGSTVRIVKPAAAISFESEDVLYGGYVGMASGLPYNQSLLVLENVRIELPTGLAWTGAIKLTGCCEIHSDTSYNALSLTRADVYFGADVSTLDFPGVQFVGADDIDRPYLYCLFSTGHIAAVCGYLNIYSSNNFQLYSGRFTQGLDQQDSWVYPGVAGAVFGASHTQYTWITGAGFGIVNVLGGYQSWQGGRCVSLDSSEAFNVSNWGRLKNTTATVFEIAGTLKVDVGAQALVSSWAGAPPGGGGFSAGITSPSTGATIAAGDKIGPNATDPMACIIRPN